MSSGLPELPHGGQVRGVGIDLVDCARIRSAMERHGERFLQRVFTATELEYCLGMKEPVPSLAARFAAKEAVAKAFTTGIGAELGWQSIEVVRGSREQPLIRLDAGGIRLMRQLGCREVLISLSHTNSTATAIALLIV